MLNSWYREHCTVLQRHNELHTPSTKAATAQRTKHQGLWYIIISSHTKNISTTCSRTNCFCLFFCSCNEYLSQRIIKKTCFASYSTWTVFYFLKFLFSIHLDSSLFLYSLSLQSRKEQSKNLKDWSWNKDTVKEAPSDFFPIFFLWQARLAEPLQEKVRETAAWRE